MSKCSFCNQRGHRINQCNSSMIAVFENCIKMNAAYDYYLGLQTTYLKLYLTSLNMQVLRVIGYKYNILFTNQPKCSPHVPYNKFIQQFVLHYSYVPNETYIERINSIPHSKIRMNAESIHQFLLRNNIHTNWTPTSISSILLSTRLLSIQLNIEKNIQLNKYDDCSICLEKIEPDKCCTFTCSHYFCSGCVFHYIERLHISHNPYLLCPLCRSDVTNIAISESHYKECVHRIKKIKSIQINLEIDDSETDMNTITSLIVEHPRFEKMKYVFFLTVRLYLLFAYIEYAFSTVNYFVRNANSYHSQDRLQR